MASMKTDVNPASCKWLPAADANADADAETDSDASSSLMEIK